MDYALIETFRWEPQAGFIRGAAHLGRMAQSAGQLGFAFDRQEADAALARALAGQDAPARVRVEMDRSGRFDVTTSPFSPLTGDTTWTLAVARDAVIDSNDPLIRHKTTRRGVYDAARSEFSRDAADEVLLCNEDGALCEGTITNLFVRTVAGAPLATPMLSCGLLPGILRRELIAGGQAIEAVVTAEMVRSAAECFVGNSLRGLIRARLP